MSEVRSILTLSRIHLPVRPGVIRIGLGIMPTTPSLRVWRSVLKSVGGGGGGGAQRGRIGQRFSRVSCWVCPGGSFIWVIGMSGREARSRLTCHFLCLMGRLRVRRRRWRGWWLVWRVGRRQSVMGGRRSVYFPVGVWCTVQSWSWTLW